MTGARTAHILIVDDDEILARRLTDLARELGFEVTEAHDGAQALAAVHQRTPDIVVTDLHMPRLSGRELVPRLRAMSAMADHPIIVLTADAGRDSKIELLHAGADDFIVKPIHADEFQARLMALVRRSELVAGVEGLREERDRALRQLEARNKELERLTMGLVAALERANSLNDADTGFHIRRVSLISELLARVARRGHDEVQQIRQYAGLHDVGKVGLRDGILRKPGRLTPDEFEEMKTHTIIGAELLRAAGLPPAAVNIALSHHERWDGGGYPQGLAGEGIPIEARIVAVADVFDALRSKRVYKAAYGMDETLHILREEAGSHLDLELVGLLVQHLDDVRLILSQYPDEPELAEAWG